MFRAVRNWLKRLLPFLPYDSEDSEMDRLLRRRNKIVFFEKQNGKRNTVRGNKVENGDELGAALESHKNPLLVDGVMLIDTNVQNIPVSIGKFSNMTTLIMNNNCINEIPWSLIYLNHLEVLNLSANSLTELPLIVGYMESLRELYLNKNKLHFLPTSLLKLTKLEILEVCGNPNMESPPLTICSQGKEAIFRELLRRHGRVNVLAGATPWYSEENVRGEKGKVHFGEVDSLMKIAIDCILECQVDYLSLANVPPRLKSHLQTTESKRVNQIQISACSECRGYFSTQARFDVHLCKGRRAQ